jgi:endonuclease I
MRKWRIITILFLILQAYPLLSQPAGYYSDAAGLTGTELKSALHNIIDDHTVSSYSDLWIHFQKTDRKTDGSVWDIYSSVVWTFITDQCGNYSDEGDCYNREHSFPKSWFGGEVLPMYTDLFHIYPTDGWVNNKRGNLPFGETSSPVYTSSNGSSVGPSSTQGYSGTVFEPIDEYKGDLARSCFYMAVRYYGEDVNWPGGDMTDGAEPVPWALNLLLRWHEDDPVSSKENNRNDSVYTIQGNRNPFIDNPGYASAIWDSSSDILKRGIPGLSVWPNPAREIISFSIPGQAGGTVSLSIISPTGHRVMEIRNIGSGGEIDISSLSPGIYFAVFQGDGFTARTKIVVL